MNRKKVLIGLALVVAAGLIVFLATRNRTTDHPDTDVVRVAAILNLTGPSARFDAVKQQTLNLALERLRESRPNTRIELKVFDAGGGPEATTVAVRQALDWGATYLLSGTSPTALAIAAQVRNRTPPVVQIANAANPDFGPPRPAEYRFWVDWKQEADVVKNVFDTERINNVLLIHSADPYSQALTNELREKVRPLTGFVMREFQYDPASTPDFRPALLRAKAEGVQAVVIFGLPPGINALMSQMSEAGWDRALIGGVNINLAVSAYDTARLTGPLWVVETEAMQENLRAGSEAELFRNAYRQRHNETPPFHALYMADALYFIVAAQNEANKQNVQSVELVKRVRTFESASGQIGAGEDGNLRFVMSARRIR
jgi:ABC-type branched-subunit amino acid transport system substrate-binding protein